MSFDAASFGGATLVKARNRIDMSNADAFKDALMAALAGAKSAVIVDMSGVDYISSAGLRSLMIAHRSAKGESKAFAVAALNPLVLEIFTISRFNLVLSLYPSVRGAFEVVAPDGLSSFDVS
jgi:anti-sigma B factor antagonist/stage II sporulation protein AA (anti-sigma F factor antagonist)